MKNNMSNINLEKNDILFSIQIVDGDIKYWKKENELPDIFPSKYGNVRIYSGSQMYVVLFRASTVMAMTTDDVADLLVSCVGVVVESAPADGMTYIEMSVSSYDKAGDNIPNSKKLADKALDIVRVIGEKEPLLKNIILTPTSSNSEKSEEN